MKKFIVSVNYQNTQGNPKSRRVTIASNEENTAIDKAIKITKSTRKVMKIMGGDVIKK